MPLQPKNAPRQARRSFLALAAAVPALAQTLFTDNFDTGVSGASWQVMVNNANYQILVGDNAHAFGTGSAKQVQANGEEDDRHEVIPVTAHVAHHSPRRCRDRANRGDGDENAHGEKR